MKKQAKQDLQTKTIAELRKLLKEAQAALVQLRLDHQQVKLQNTRSLFHKRKEIAVLHTIMQGKGKEEGK
ncbi:MAG: 50S ribosomal protein L29 [Patescibacteria group bacterium]